MSVNENEENVELEVISCTGSSVVESSSEEDEELSTVDESWIGWFCNLNGNIFFCNIEKSFIEDSFNLFGLKQYLTKDFTRVLDTILDKLDESSENTDSEDLSRSAALLYGLIHARYIVTSMGMEAMFKKFLDKDFGECPRYFCKGQGVLPVGVTDEPKQGILKLYCPKCKDIYHCNPNQQHIDGAYFGTTFPHLFLMTYERLVPTSPTHRYIPKVFGFKIHNGDENAAKVAASVSNTPNQRSPHFQNPRNNSSSNSNNNDMSRNQNSSSQQQMVRRSSKLIGGLSGIEEDDEELRGQKTIPGRQWKTRSQSSNTLNNIISNSSSTNKSLLPVPTLPSIIYQPLLTIPPSPTTMINPPFHLLEKRTISSTHVDDIGVSEGSSVSKSKRRKRGFG